MPYTSLEELPQNVRHVLPIHAQEIYLSSFNHAHEEYKNKEKRRNPEENLEVLCHKIAWSAVKLKYFKNKNDQWVKKI